MTNIDLKEFYKSNITKGEYYYQFYDLIMSNRIRHNVFNEKVEVIETEYILFDEQECIEKFKSLCLPENEYTTEREPAWFYLTTFYLYKNNYHIDLFPNLFQRPPKNPHDFINKEIRDYLISHTNEYDISGKISWESRRHLVNNLKIIKDYYFLLKEDIKKLIIDISTRNASFENMTRDEKLEVITNVIENMLKENKQFLKIDYSKISNDLITDELIRAYRKITQCFRHATKIDIEERKNISDTKKDFLINYGILICTLIYESLKDKE